MRVICASFASDRLSVSVSDTLFNESVILITDTLGSTSARQALSPSSVILLVVTWFFTVSPLEFWLMVDLVVPNFLFSSISDWVPVCWGLVLGEGWLSVFLQPVPNRNTIAKVMVPWFKQ